MKTILSKWLIASLVYVLAANAVWAKAPPDQAAKLGGELTFAGAEAKGNADGSITEWIGKTAFPESLIKITHAGLEEQRKNLDPKSRELLKEAEAAKDAAGLIAIIPKIVAVMPANIRESVDVKIPGMTKSPVEAQVVITKDNLAEHESKLTEGHKAMFKTYPNTYKMVVFPSVRNAFFPDEVNKATVANAANATLTGTDQVSGAKLGFPFPIPQSGAEALWNHKMKYRGSAVRRFNNQAIVKPDGTFKISKLVEDVKFKYANLKEPPPADNKLLLTYLQRVMEPPRVAGQITLVHETAGSIEGGGRSAWLYNPGLGRVNRAPDVGYDGPQIGSDGEQFFDQVDVFNGALDRFDWKLVGKKELYIPYNSWIINAPSLKYGDLIRPGHINPVLARYELHRVWVVEATVRQGIRHKFAKRVFYIDEDSWSIAVVDCYDARGQMWKVQEAHLLTIPFIPTVSGIPELIYDLQSKRYFTTTMTNEDPYSNWEINWEDAYFTQSNIAKLSRTK
ncbi:MAG: DUF1329 domain-containing protein [Nevskiales bacterium]